jgi:hypothetical protein
MGEATAHVANGETVNWPYFLIYVGTRTGAALSFVFAGVSLADGSTFNFIMLMIIGMIFWLSWKWYEEKKP